MGSIKFGPLAGKEVEVRPTEESIMLVDIDGNIVLDLLLTSREADDIRETLRVAYEKSRAQQALLPGMSALPTKTPTPEGCLAGEHDGLQAEDVSKHLVSARAVAVALLALWSRTWGQRSVGDALAAAGRGVSLAKALRQGYKVSDFAKAIVGMRYDDWHGRAKNNGWPFVVRDMDRWLALYAKSNDGKKPPPPIADRETKVVKARCGRTFSVPSDYVWDERDEYAAQMGWTFSFGARKWVSE